MNTWVREYVDGTLVILFIADNGATTINYIRDGSVDEADYGYQLRPDRFDYSVES